MSRGSKIGPEIIILLVAFTVGLISFFVGKGKSLDDYNNLMYVNSMSVKNIEDELSFGTPTVYSCQLPICNNRATKKLSFRNYDTVVKGAYDKILAIDNSANLSIKTNSFTYAPDEKRYVYDSGVYIVPQGDGSFKLENRTYKYEYTTKGKASTTQYVDIYGYYCDEHAQASKITFMKEVKDQFVTKNPVFWIACVSIPAVCLIVCVIMLIIAIRKVRNHV